MEWTEPPQQPRPVFDFIGTMGAENVVRCPRCRCLMLDSDTVLHLNRCRR